MNALARNEQASIYYPIHLAVNKRCNPHPPLSDCRPPHFRSHDSLDQQPALLLTTPLTAAQGTGNLLIISTQPPIPSPWAVDSLCLCSLACFLPSFLPPVSPHPVFLVLTHNKLFLRPIHPSKCVRSSASTVRLEFCLAPPDPTQRRPPPPLVHAFCSLPASHRNIRAPLPPPPFHDRIPGPCHPPDT